MPVRHIVWDWNGTLLDDLPIVIDALNVGIQALGLAPIGEDEYRDHFTRPVRAFYDSLFGRPVTDMEWMELNKMFHDEYFARVRDAKLTIDAMDALALADAQRWSQSLLSMSPHVELVEIVESHDLLPRFIQVDGLREETGGLKARHLQEHVESVGTDPRDVVVIGDTPDDATAARQIGAHVILYDGGSHHIPTLEAMSAPVAHTLTSAVALARSIG